MSIPDDAVELLGSGRPAHLVTLNQGGSPQVSLVWVGVEEDEIVSAHLSSDQRKLANVRRDPRVSLSMEAGGTDRIGLARYLVVHGIARITDGGAPELLQRLARVYLGPGTRFPPMDDPPPGHILRIRPLRYGGNGPWAGAGG